MSTSGGPDGRPTAEGFEELLEEEREQTEPDPAGQQVPVESTESMDPRRQQDPTITPPSEREREREIGVVEERERRDRRERETQERQEFRAIEREIEREGQDVEPVNPGGPGGALSRSEGSGEIDVRETFEDIRSGEFQEQLDERTREEFEEQAEAQRRGEGILPPRSEIIDRAGEAARGPDFLDTQVGRIVTGQVFSPVDDPAAAREGFARGAVKILPLNPFQATLETAELAEEGEEFVGNVRTTVLGAGETRREAQEEVVSDLETAGITAAAVPGLLRTEVEERPFETAGAAASLVVGGVAGGRAIERAPSVARSARIRAKGGKIHPREDVSDPPRVLEGGLPGLSREVVDDPAAARREFLEQAEQNVIGGDAPTVFHGRAAEDVRRFGAMTEEFEAPEAPVRPKDPPGMAFSADLSPLRIPGVGEVTSGISSPIRAPRPRLRAPARIAAEEDVDVGIMQGETIPGASKFMETADPEQSFIRSRGIMSPEQEAFAPEGATFTPTGEVFGVRAGRDIIPGRTFRRGQGGEAPDDVISGQQLAEESTEARRDISSSAKRAEQSGEPFSRGMAGELFSRGMGSIDPSAPGPTGSIIPGADSSSTPPSTPPTAPPSGPSIFGIEDLSVPGTPPSTPPTAPPSGPTIPGIEDFSVPGPPTDPPSEPPTGPPSEPPIAPPSWPPTGPPSKPPTAPPSEPPTGPPSVPPSMPPSSPPPSSPPPSSPPPSIPGLPQAGGPPSPFGEFSLPSRSEDEDRETPIPAGQEFQNPIASGAQFLFGGFGGQVPSGGDATEDIIGLFGGERSGG